MKFNLFSTSDQKANADETVQYLMDGLGYKQNLVPEFVRLGCGLVAAIVAAALFFWERKVGWVVAYPYIVAGVIAYFGLNGAAFLVQRFVEMNAIYIGQKDGKTVYIKTQSPKCSELYRISVLRDGKWVKAETKFSDFVDYNGRALSTKLQPLLASLVNDKKSQ